MIKYERQGDLIFASGDNWKYEQLGELYVFTQTGKVPSLRVIKTMIKLLGKIGVSSLPVDPIYQGGGGGCNYGLGAIGQGGGSSAFMSQGGGIGADGCK